MLLRTYRPNQATTGFHIRLLFYIPWVRIPEPNRDRKEGRNLLQLQGRRTCESSSSPAPSIPTPVVANKVGHVARIGGHGVSSKAAASAGLLRAPASSIYTSRGRCRKSESDASCLAAGTRRRMSWCLSTPLALVGSCAPCARALSLSRDDRTGDERWASCCWIME
jgi:hypothetical protein